MAEQMKDNEIADATTIYNHHKNTCEECKRIQQKPKSFLLGYARQCPEAWTLWGKSI